MNRTTTALLVSLSVCSISGCAQQYDPQVSTAQTDAIPTEVLARALEEFRWVNPLPDDAPEGMTHHVYRSSLMESDVGYVIYLPSDYNDPARPDRRFPVVYHLHGGIRGNESRIPQGLTGLTDALEENGIPSRIYVYVNGGSYSHYDFGSSLAETTFVTELIPHIDEHYRTIPTRLGRGIEGFSAGGRGTARIVFEHPELFCSAIALAGGHQHEKLVSEGRASETGYGIPLPRDYNSWDRASSYADRGLDPPLELLIAVGTDDMNYDANLAWMDHLRSLEIPFESRLVPGLGHSMGGLFNEIGGELLTFHERCFRRATQ